MNRIMHLNKSKKGYKGIFIAILYLFVTLQGVAQQTIKDVIIFANNTSEKAHQLSAGKSKTIVGGLKESARIILPKDTDSWEGGRISFVMKVDPEKQNYFTVRFWGSDKDKSMILLFCEGKQVGYRHLGLADINLKK